MSFEVRQLLAPPVVSGLAVVPECRLARRGQLAAVYGVNAAVDYLSAIIEDAKRSVRLAAASRAVREGIACFAADGVDLR